MKKSYTILKNISETKSIQKSLPNPSSLNYGKSFILSSLDCAILFFCHPSFCFSKTSRDLRVKNPYLFSPKLLLTFPKNVLLFLSSTALIIALRVRSSLASFIAVSPLTLFALTFAPFAINKSTTHA